MGIDEALVQYGQVAEMFDVAEQGQGAAHRVEVVLKLDLFARLQLVVTFELPLS